MNFKLWLETKVSGRGDLFAADTIGNVHLIRSTANGPELYQFIKSLTSHKQWSLETIEEEFEGQNALQALQTIFQDSHQGVFGKIDRNTLVIMNKPMLSPSSLLLKKLSQALGGRKIALYGQEFKPTGNVNLVFHGTAEKYLPQIMKTGLIPNSNSGNWNVKVTGVNTSTDRPIYLSTDFNVAKGHADNAAENTGSRPVVLTIKIPDRSKIDYDYDAFNHEADYDVSFDKINQHRKMYNSTRETGLMAYDGRIPPTHIIKTTFV